MALHRELLIRSGLGHHGVPEELWDDALRLRIVCEKDALNEAVGYFWDQCYDGGNHCRWYPVQRSLGYEWEGEHLEVVSISLHACCRLGVTYSVGTACYTVLLHSRGRVWRRTVPLSWKAELLEVIDEALARGFRAP